MKLLRNLWFTLAIALAMICALGACQPKGPDESKVTDLIKQAEDIYHANHNTLPSVENLLMFQNKNNPTDIRYYDEVADYDKVVSAVFTENGIRQLEHSSFQEGPVIFRRAGKVYHISNVIDKMGIVYFDGIDSVKLVKNKGNSFTYQVESRPKSRGESLDDPPVWGEPKQYQITVVEKDGMLLMDDFPYPAVTNEGNIDMEDYILPEYTSIDCDSST